MIMIMGMEAMDIVTTTATVMDMPMREEVTTMDMDTVTATKRRLVKHWMVHHNPGKK